MLALIMNIENRDDREKAKQLYRLYKGTMLFVANKVLHDTYLAEDAVSESFVKILKNLHKINDVDCNETKGFVVIIVRNTSIDMLKKLKRELPIEEIEETADAAEPVFDEVATKVAYEQIMEGIGKLQKSYSDILYLKAAFGYSNEEIAEVLGISAENTKVRLSRARKALLRQLREMGGVYDEQ
ncbi:MAG: RNA polymerase sigma factor [Anaerofustis sp.]